MKPMSSNLVAPRNRQRGAVTLVITMLILVAVALGMYSMVGTTSIESRMSANEKRGRQAIQAAQAGIDYLVAGLSRPVVDRTYLCETAENTKQKYGFVLDYGDTACEQVPFEILTKLERVRSIGYSSDRDAVRVIESTIDLSSSWDWGLSAASRPEDVGNAAVVTRGNASLSGASQATTCATMAACKDVAAKGRQDGSLVGNTLLAGGSVTLGGRAAEHEGHYTQNDEALRSLSDEALFQKYATGGTMSRDEFKNTAFKYNPANTAESNNNANTTGNPLIYVPGDLTVQGGTIGSPDKPVVLYIDGNLRANGNLLVWGVVYVKSMDSTKGGGPGGNGTVNVLGRFISEEAISANGNLAVYYNPDLMIDPTDVDPSALLANQSGKTATVRVGSWREVTLPVTP